MPFIIFFLDLNECDDEIYTCPANSECVNSVGSYKCECQLGFAGDDCAGENCIMGSQVIDCASCCKPDVTTSFNRNITAVWPFFLFSFFLGWFVFSLLEFIRNKSIEIKA